MNLLCTRRCVPLSCYVAAPRNPIFKLGLHYFCWLEALGFADDAVCQVYRSLGSWKEGENMLSWLPLRDLTTLCHSPSWRQDLLQPSYIYLSVTAVSGVLWKARRLTVIELGFPLFLAIGERRKQFMGTGKRTVSFPFSSPCMPCHYTVTLLPFAPQTPFPFSRLLLLKCFLALRTGSSLLWEQRWTWGSTEVYFKLSSAEKANFVLVYPRVSDPKHITDVPLCLPFLCFGFVT